ncbi:ketopantoate reductase PanE/ApbA-domain-containing protein [Cercophora newfieldiana]|uniref:Ketopantoate reductase PanE/ApbA-domain-containing protein n=1 Tax=Cercophora newfieldiana TaxID=92897 RepID=A0AA39XWG5_9PEZI|nr:ketopantoate reductase PanE/ApbA-domain-containing protein [Cercophora newfieldiana]
MTDANKTDGARPVHIVFVGAGAVGCFYASRLHHPARNIHTSLIARSNYATLREHGVSLKTHSFGDYTFAPASVFPSPSAAAAAPHAWDFVVVTTKALPDRSDDAALIAPLVTEGTTTILLIQNGVGVEAPYRARFPSTPIVSGVTVISAEQISPGTVRQNRWTRIHLGPYSHSADPDSAESRVDAELEKRGREKANQIGDWWARLGGIRDVEVEDELDLQLIRWHKLTINAAFNPSAVLSGGRPNADMVGDQELRAHLKGVMEEIWEAVPRVLGGRRFPAELASPERILKSTERNVGGRPSMLVDWEAGRPMELEVILGNPVRIARGRGVSLGRMQGMYALLRSMQEMRERERKGRGDGKFLLLSSVVLVGQVSTLDGLGRSILPKGGGLTALRIMKLIEEVQIFFFFFFPDICIWGRCMILDRFSAGSVGAMSYLPTFAELEICQEDSNLFCLRQAIIMCGKMAVTLGLCVFKLGLCIHISMLKI